MKENGNNRNFEKDLAIFCNKIKRSESVCKQPTQLVVELNSSLWQKLDTLVVTLDFEKLTLYHQVSTVKETI